MRRLEDDDDIVCFFPEDKGIEVGTVVKHKRYPDTTVGFVTKVRVEPPGPTSRGEKWDIDVSGTIVPDSHRYIDQHEVEWSAPPERRTFTSGSISGFGGIYMPYVPLQVTPTLFAVTGSIKKI